MHIDFVMCKKLKGGPFGDKSFEKKVAQCRKKIERGYSLVPSGFVGYLEKVKNERGTLCTQFALAPRTDWAP